MDRRASFSFLGKSSRTARPSATPVPSGTLAPYSGPWTLREAGHLMRRATFAPSQSMIQEALDLGLEGAINKLLTENSGVPEPPLKWFYDEPHPDRQIRRFIPYVDDPEVEYGETWVNAKLIPGTGDPQRDNQINNYRNTSLFGWMMDLMNKDNFSLREKMAIFWHNHFVVSEFRIPKMTYQYMNTIYRHVLGDFKQLTKEITIDPSMLLYLNGAENTKAAPNENYARELLELFTVGKGNVAGPGDYTTFTEDDVREIAKALTGWTLDLRSVQGSNVEVVYYFFNHDNSVKQLSHRFNNAVINPAGDQEYKNVIDTIFESDNVGLFIARKLYRYFVHYNITAEVEANVIEPLAQVLRDNDYNIGEAVKALLSSEHFYGEEAIGCMIKNPVDFYLSFIKGMGIQNDGQTSFLRYLDLFVDGTILDYYNAIILFNMASEAGMSIFQHPDVAGWKAYYQEPTFYRTWLNTATLPVRIDHSNALINGLQTTVGDTQYDFQESIPVLDIVAALDLPQDPNRLILDLAERFFPYGITEGQKDYLKEILIPGLPDFEWTVEYSDYVSDPADPQKKEAVENRLRALFTALLEMPEAQLM